MNLKKLAQDLNLSVSTISKAFRGSYDISPDTRARILARAKELNFQPNPMASGLRTQKSKTIAVIIPEIANNFFTLAINGIESVAQEKGYHVLIYITHEDKSKEVAFMQHLQNGRVDGVLMSLSGNTEDYRHLDHIKELQIPIIFFDRVYHNSATSRVTTDDFQSSYLATQHLIDRGCKRIAHLFVSPKLSISRNRLEGYLMALKENNMEISQELILDCSDEHQHDQVKIKTLLEIEKPDGVFSSFEKLAMDVYRVCEEKRIQIPHHLKIISFSNLEIASLLKPSLTTITQPAFEIGKKAASVLFQSLEKKSFKIPDEHIILKSVLIPRGSTGV